jgi:hypothetical protein
MTTFSFVYSQDWGEQMVNQINPSLSGFGLSVAIDGDFAVIGAPHEDTQTGSATIYKRDENGVWNQIQKIDAYIGKSENDLFGYAVAIEGDYIFVSALLDRVNEVDFEIPAGSVLIYKKDANDNWEGVQRIRSSDIEHSDHFGSSISVDGDYLLVGAEWENDDNAGAAYVYKKDANDIWVETQKLVASHRSNSDKIGKSVAINGDYIVLGSNSDTDINNANPINGNGSAFIFKKDANGVWIETQKLKPSDGAVHSLFGGAGVSLSGNHIAIGAVGSNSDQGNAGKGAVYMFKQDENGVWNETQKITIDYNGDSGLGRAVDLKGNLLIATTPTINGDDNGTNISNAGGAYLFSKNENDIWTETLKISTFNIESNAEVGGGPNSYGDETCLAVGLSNNHFIIGAQHKDIQNVVNAGAAYFSGNLASLGFTGKRITNIPDDNFENYLETHDKNGNTVALGDANSMGNGVENDDKVFTENIENVQTLIIEKLEIEDITGIQDFTAIETLNCASNHITSINLIENINLTSLQCQNNSLTALNVQNENNENFILFNATTNVDLLCIQVDDIDYSNNNWSDGINNQTIFSLDCESNGADLTYVPDNNFEAYLEANNMGNNIDNDNYVFTASIENITFLNIQNLVIGDATGIEDFTALQTFNCKNNNLSSLDLTQNLSLRSLQCQENNLSTINLSQNTLLHTIYASDNNFSLFDVSLNTALINLNISRNQLQSINISQNSSLRDLNIDTNQLSTIDVSQNPELRYLNCNVNTISVLNVNNNPELISLNCNNNTLLNLNVNQNINLEYLSCSSNQLSSLNVGSNAALISLTCNNNDLENLDVSQNSLLTSLSCYGNELTELNVQNNNNVNFISFRATNNENLMCIQVDDVDYSNNNWSNGINNQTEFALDCSSLSIKDFDLSEISIHPNPTSSLLEINISSELLNYNIEVFNIQGKKVLVKDQLKHQSKINIKHLKKGVYFLRILTNKSSYIKKVIKI